MDNMENYEDVMENEEVTDEIEVYEPEESGVNPGILIGAAVVGGAAVAVGSAIKRRFIDPKLEKIKEKYAEKRSNKENEVVVIDSKDVEVIDDKVENDER